jgi:hypothetical protein
MARYLYLILGLIFLAPTVVVAIWRRDLRRSVISVAIFGAVWGPISEFWFFRDYWHPGSAFGSPLLEDVIYGAGISATASWLYKVLAHKSYDSFRRHRTHFREACAIAVLYVVAMIVLEMILGINSILVAIGVYVIGSSYIVVRRRDLVTASVWSCVMMGLIALFGYGVGLNFLVHGPNVLSEIWLLYKKPLGITILGYVPLTEVVWYAAWGSLLGVLYEFATGRCLVHAGRVAKDGAGILRPLASDSPEVTCAGWARSPIQRIRQIDRRPKGDKIRRVRETGAA